MHRLVLGLLTVLLMFLGAFDATAQANVGTVQPKSETAAEAANTGDFEADEAAIPETVTGFVVEALKNDSNAAEANRKQALLDFYGRSDAQPLWVEESGLNTRARALAAELARAGDYGLEPADYALPKPDASYESKQDRARAELQISRSVLEYAHHAKGGRIDPASVRHQLYQHPEVPEPAAILKDIAAASDPAAYLRTLHPTHPQFEALRKKLRELRGEPEGGKEARLPDGPALRLGDKHEQVAILRKRLGLSGDSLVFDEALDNAVRTFQRENGLSADGVVGSGTRRALNGDSDDALLVRVLVNMERWRWLPDDLDGNAGMYVWANIPEFRVRVVDSGKVVFDERAIMGLLDKQTPVFSDSMEWIEFHPTWYIPNSIKEEDILPSLKRRTSTIMERYHLSMDCGRHGRDPAKIDWSVVDIKTCSFTQPPGDKSVLGDFKFKFPNDHDVYMHDTPTVALFQRDVRTFSHGCVRVQNPRHMAEVILGHDKGMQPERIAAILKGPKQLHKEELLKPVPVHITYFTAFVGDDGTFTTRPDYYGHDRRLAEALTGDGHLISLPAATVRHFSAREERERRPAAATRDWRNDVLMMQN